MSRPWPPYSRGTCGANTPAVHGLALQVGANTRVEVLAGDRFDGDDHVADEASRAGAEVLDLGREGEFGHASSYQHIT